jgi:hypothetical protein
LFDKVFPALTNFNLIFKKVASKTGIITVSKAKYRYGYRVQCSGSRSELDPPGYGSSRYKNELNLTNKFYSPSYRAQVRTGSI